VGVGLQQAVKHFVSRAAAKYGGIGGWVYTAAHFADCYDRCMGRMPCPARRPARPDPMYSPLGYEEGTHGNLLYY